MPCLCIAVGDKDSQQQMTVTKRSAVDTGRDDEAQIPLNPDAKLPLSQQSTLPLPHRSLGGYPGAVPSAPPASDMAELEYAQIAAVHPSETAYGRAGLPHQNSLHSIPQNALLILHSEKNRRQNIPVTLIQNAYRPEVVSRSMSHPGDSAAEESPYERALSLRGVLTSDTSGLQGILTNENAHLAGYGPGYPVTDPPPYEDIHRDPSFPISDTDDISGTSP